MFNDGQIHIAKWVRNALDLNDGDELLFEVVVISLVKWIYLNILPLNLISV